MNILPRHSLLIALAVCFVGISLRDVFKSQVPKNSIGIETLPGPDHVNAQEAENLLLSPSGNASKEKAKNNPESQFSGKTDSPSLQPGVFPAIPQEQLDDAAHDFTEKAPDLTSAVSSDEKAKRNDLGTSSDRDAERDSPETSTTGDSVQDSQEATLAANSKHERTQTLPVGDVEETSPDALAEDGTAKQLEPPSTAPQKDSLPVQAAVTSAPTLSVEATTKRQETVLDDEEFDDTPVGRRRYFEELHRRGFFDIDNQATVNATRKIRPRLAALIAQLSIRDIVDVGCGPSVRWIDVLLRNVSSDVTYTGVDIVPEVIGRHGKAGYDERMEFMTVDVAMFTPPVADLIVARNLFSVMPARILNRTLRVLSASGAKWLVATTYPETERNPTTDDWKAAISGARTRFRWNLAEKPWALGPPLLYLTDLKKARPMGLWRLPLWRYPSRPYLLDRWPDTRIGRTAMFTTIWREGHWARGTAGPVGRFSTKASTAKITDALPKLVTELQVTSVLDVGCGDAAWMGPLLPALNVSFTGLDIVDELIYNNTERYGHAQGRVEFKIADAAEDVLPRADLILCRHVLQYMRGDTVLATLSNLAKSGAQWLLATTYPETETNAEEEPAEQLDVFLFVDWNLELAPFGLGAPIRILEDAFLSRLGLWPLSRLHSAQPPTAQPAAPVPDLYAE